MWNIRDVGKPFLIWNLGMAVLVDHVFRSSADFSKVGARLINGCAKTLSELDVKVDSSDSSFVLLHELFPSSPK